MKLADTDKRKDYIQFVRWYIETHVDLYEKTGFKNIDRLLNSASNLHLLFKEEKTQKNIQAALLLKKAPGDDTLNLIIKAFGVPLDYDDFLGRKTYENLFYKAFLKSEDYSNRIENKKNAIKKTELVTINKWHASTKNSAPQWADYLKIPVNGGFIKQIDCKVLSNSEYYRFGFKLFRANGKLFGDGSIQSLDNNFVIHIGKNFITEDLFITIYRNGILERPDTYTNIKALNKWINIKFYIDDENFFHFVLNDNEVYNALLNKEIREQIYMLAWADGNKFKLRVRDIKIEFDNV